MSGRPVCTISRSRSVWRRHSPRPSPPVASSAMPATGGSSRVSQPSTAAVRAVRAAAPMPSTTGGGGGAAAPTGSGAVPRSRGPLERIDPAFAGADPDHLIDRGDPDLTVADAAGAGGGHDRVDRLVDVEVVDQHLDPCLGHEV